MSTNEQLLDTLTGLLNRKGYEEKIIAAILFAQQTNTPLSLAFLDIDHFKRLNDSLGHDAGDTVINAVGKAIRAGAGEQAIVSRYGGEEYAVIFPNTEREQAFLTIERIRGEIAALPSLSDGVRSVEAHVTISGGIAAFPIDATDEGELFRKADEALYRAKVSGRNKISLAYDERMAPKTSHYTVTQLERLSKVAKDQGVGEAVLLREALDALLIKYEHGFINHPKTGASPMHNGL
jgi:diguanylate cyclase (GGDEF)-like protein